jgi:hypothetical protein
MGRAERRGKSREEAKRAETAQRAASKPGPDGFRNTATERPETRGETARRIYRTGVKPKRRGKIGRRASDKPRKWREGHQ